MKRLKDTSKCASLQKGKQHKGITSTIETLDVDDDIDCGVFIAAFQHIAYLLLEFLLLTLKK